MSKKRKKEKDSKCPYCGEQGKPCSYLKSLASAYARGACAKKHDNVKIHSKDSMDTQ